MEISLSTKDNLRTNGNCIPQAAESNLVVPELDDDREDIVGDRDAVMVSNWPTRFVFGGNAAEKPPVGFGTLGKIRKWMTRAELSRSICLHCDKVIANFSKDK